MKTRRSWRNQERLWRALGVFKIPAKPAKLLTPDEVRAAEFARKIAFARKML